MARKTTDDLVRPTRALISVSDKAGVVELAAHLVGAHDIEIFSTGGTYDLLQKEFVPARKVEELTHFPEMMDGRLKTLHPAVHGGLLGVRDSAEHRKSMANQGIEPIDILVVNLYPFQETVASGASHDKIVEKIDIGGPAMLRSAAKNHQWVTVVVDRDDYEKLMDELDQYSGTTLEFRQYLAYKVFEHTAGYEAAIASYLRQTFKLGTL